MKTEGKRKHYTEEKLLKNLRQSKFEPCGELGLHQIALPSKMSYNLLTPSPCSWTEPPDGEPLPPPLHPLRHDGVVCLALRPVLQPVVGERAGRAPEQSQGYHQAAAVGLEQGQRGTLLLQDWHWQEEDDGPGSRSILDPKVVKVTGLLAWLRPWLL